MTGPQRMHARYAHQAAVAFRVGTAIIAGRTMNVSRGGLCAGLPRAIPAGSEVIVNIQLSFGDGWYSEPLRVPGQVAWCTQVDDIYLIGLAFRRLDAESAMYLTLFLRYLDPGLIGERTARPATIDERFR